MTEINLFLGDCIELMKEIPDGSIDMILTDPPYGTTQCKWDTVIDLDLMWAQLKRIIKPRGGILLFAQQPFTSALVMSNPKWFKFCFIWDKVKPGGHFVAKIRPMQRTEDIAVFGKGKLNYYPIMVPRDKAVVGKEYKRTEIVGGGEPTGYTATYTHKYPTNVVEFSNAANQGKKVHPTQKPIPLLEYLIKTYSLEGETVLDFTMGSGSAGVACVNTSRNFIGIERDEKYFEIAKERIEASKKED